MSRIINVKTIRVSPGIGMARVGNSDEYFIGPETPGVVPIPTSGNYKDANGALKPQAQRFRVFAYGSENQLIGEVKNGDSINGTVVKLKWDVHVTNMKSANYAFQGKYAFNKKQLRNSTIQNTLAPSQRSRLIIDPGLKEITGNSSGPVELIDNEGNGSVIFDVADMVPVGGFTLPAAVQFDPPQSSDSPTQEIAVTYQSAKVSLGNLYTDESGRLIFVGGKGKSESCTTPSVIISKIATTDIHLKDKPEYNGNSYFNNPGWYDDTCGGSINAQLIDTSGNVILKTDDKANQRGWIGVAPPNYSPATNNVVSLLDLQLDIYPEIDPYTGQGPMLIATNASNELLYIGESTNGINFTYTQVGGSLMSNKKPSIVSEEADVYIAITANDNKVYVSTKSGRYDFSAISSTIGTQLAPALAAFNGQLHIAIIANDGRPYIASSSTFKSSSFSFKPINQSVLFGAPQSDFSPAVLAYDGSLYIAYISTNQEILLSVRNNQTQKYATQKIGHAENAKSGPSLSFFKGKLAIAYNDNNIIKLATSFIHFDSDAAYDFKFKLVATVPAGTGIDDFSPSLSYFNNKLYLTNINSDKDILTGVSSDASSFTFSNSGTGLTTLGGSGIATHEAVNFFRDIYPILHTVTDYSWTNERAFHGHRPGSQGDFLRKDYLALLAEPSFGTPNDISNQPNADARVFVFDFIRPPAEVLEHPFPAPPMSAPSGISSNEDQRIDLMPRLFGNGGSPDENQVNGTKFPNQWLSLTNNQLSKFQKWVNGNFSVGAKGQQRWQDIPLPQQLDFAALQPTVGGGFHPGIELTYLMHEEVFFNGPFRFAQSTVPGSIAGYMSVPWQGDFWSCNISWWPAIRPDVVIHRSDTNPPILNAIPWFRSAEIPPNADGIDQYNGGYQNMANNWHKFGIVSPLDGVTDQGEQVYIEKERDESLNNSSLLNCITSSNVGNNLQLSIDAGKVVAQSGSGQVFSQWRLIPYSGEPSYFTIESVTNGELLTIDPTSQDLSLSAQSVPHSDTQLWQYVPSGYPATFYLVAKLNGLVLTNTSGVVGLKQQQTNSSSAVTQKWKLTSS